MRVRIVMSARDPNRDLRAVTRRRANVEQPTNCLRALSHCYQPEAGPYSGFQGYIGIEAHPVVAYRHDQFVGRARKYDRHGFGVRVFGDVVERLLGNSEKCDFDLRLRPLLSLVTVNHDIDANSL